MDEETREMLDTLKSAFGMYTAKMDQLNQTLHRAIKSIDATRQAIDRSQEAPRDKRSTER